MWGFSVRFRCSFVTCRKASQWHMHHEQWQTLSAGVVWQVCVESDHKPLEAISKKSLCHAPLCLQCMLLRLQKYYYTLRCKPGKGINIADTLSRRACTTEEELECAFHLNLDTGMSEIWLQEIKEATCKDQWMQKFKKKKPTYGMDGLKSSHRYLKRYETIGIFTINYQKLMESYSKVRAVRGSMFDWIHVGNCSREVMFWPGMNKAIEQMALRCTICQEYRYSNPKEPMIPGPMPERPWEAVATDLFQWDSKDYLFLVD